MLTEKAYESGFELLTSVFTNREMAPRMWWPLLSDLDDEGFTRAILDICGNQEQLFPDSNLVAMIRKRAREISAKPKMAELPTGERWVVPDQETKEKIRELTGKIGKTGQ